MEFVFESAELLFAADSRWKHCNRLKCDVPKERIVFVIHHSENIQQCYCVPVAFDHLSFIGVCRDLVNDSLLIVDNINCQSVDFGDLSTQEKLVDSSALDEVVGKIKSPTVKISGQFIRTLRKKVGSSVFVE